MQPADGRDSGVETAGSNRNLNKYMARTHYIVFSVNQAQLVQRLLVTTPSDGLQPRVPYSFKVLKWDNSPRHGQENILQLTREQNAVSYALAYSAHPSASCSFARRFPSTFFSIIRKLMFFKRTFKGNEMGGVSYESDP